MSVYVGKSIGRYHILEKLGEGGMATVYKAFDTRLEANVAVKVIRTENLPQSGAERALKRFEREAKALAQLNHPNIVKVIDYGDYEGKPYLVMPYLEGGTLKGLMQARGALPWQEAVRVLLPIAKALAYAHQRGMIHRDVKPSNILITDSGEPMLSDFGVTKIIEEETTLDLTGTSATVGTPEYMAPEQATSKTVDHRVDIYALGIVFYEMVTGRKPYVADTPLAVLFKQASEPLPRPKQFVPVLPDKVEQIILKALAKKPEDRFQTMGEFAVALERCLAEATADQRQIKSAQASLKMSHAVVVPTQIEKASMQKETPPIVTLPPPTSTSTEPSNLQPEIVVARSSDNIIRDNKQKPPLLRNWGLIVGSAIVLLICLCMGGGSLGVASLGGLFSRPTITYTPPPATLVPTGAISNIPPIASIKPKIKIGLSFSDLTTERLKIENDQMTKILVADGYEVITQEANHDVKLQNAQIDNMVAMGVKGLIVIAEDGVAAATSVDKAAAAGVKVIAYDRLIKTTSISAYLSFNNVDVGKAEASGVMTALGIPGSTTWTSSNPAKVVLSGGSPTDNSAILVRQGQMEVVQPFIDQGVVKIVADQWVDNWDPATAKKMMENILTAQNNQIDAVVASNDGTALGELQAMKAQGLTGKVPISGQDATADGCNSIVKGELTVTVFKDTRLLAPKAVEMLEALIKGQSITGLTQYTMAELTNDKTLTGNVMALFLPVVQVTKANVYDVIIKSGFQSYADVYRDIPADQLPPTLTPAT